MFQSRNATEEELLLVHSPDHIEEMKMISLLPESTISNENSWSTATKQKSYHSVYLHPQSFNCAILAAGSLLKVRRIIVISSLQNLFPDFSIKLYIVLNGVKFKTNEFMYILITC